MPPLLSKSSCGYEDVKLRYTRPGTDHTYTPDFVLPNGIIVETKGLFSVEDRQKHLLVREQHPKLDIRLVFSRSASLLRKEAKSSYADWCRKYGIQFADKLIPQSWIDEPPCAERLQAIIDASPHALPGLP